MYAIRKDTLAGIKQSALFEPRRINPPLAATVAKLNEYMKDSSEASPEGEALKFYFSNHVFSLIASRYDLHEPLPEPVYNLARGYVKHSGDLAVRLAYYVLMITTREARHLHGQPDVFTSIKKECGKKAADFCEQLTHLNETAAVGLLRSDPPDTTLEQYLRSLVKMFSEGQWSSSFGGAKWANIAETMRRMVIGETSAEMFADTAFTLAHNGGPMFNKGMLYSMYDTYLYRLLDVQRSGQIPQLIHSESTAKELCSAYFYPYVEEARAVFPADLKGHVDWHKVEALGSLRKYPHEKAEQIKKYGKSSYVAAAVEKIEAEDVAEKNKYYVGIGSDDYAVVYKRKVKAVA